MAQAVERPWGAYEVLNEGRGFLVKRIRVDPGRRLSLQSHTHRAEHWVVISGTGRVTVGTTELRVGENTHVFIPRGARHRIENTADAIALVFVEVQTGETLLEEDIVRYDDDFGRCDP